MKNNAVIGLILMSQVPNLPRVFFLIHLTSFVFWISRHLYLIECCCHFIVCSLRPFSAWMALLNFDLRVVLPRHRVAGILLIPSRGGRQWCILTTTTTTDNNKTRAAVYETTFLDRLLPWNGVLSLPLLFRHDI